ncbi:MAG: HAD-IA family hydrolase [Chloroflexota bacterium]
MQSSSPLRAVLFDLDGTLIQSVEHIVDCWQYTVRTCLGREITREEVLPTLGRTLYDAFEEIAPGRSAELLSTYHGYQHTSHDQKITLIPGTKETLTRLKEAGLRLGVATSKGIPAATRGINLFDLAPFFDTLVTIEDTARHKPHPDPLLVASERLGVPPPEMIYVGDALVDIKAGKAAGMKTAWVTWGAGTAAEIDGMEPDYIFASMEDILVLLPIEAPNM